MLSWLSNKLRKVNKKLRTLPLVINPIKVASPIKIFISIIRSKTILESIRYLLKITVKMSLKTQEPHYLVTTHLAYNEEVVAHSSAARGVEASLGGLPSCGEAEASYQVEAPSCLGVQGVGAGDGEALCCSVRVEPVRCYKYIVIVYKIEKKK